jgi:uncharacterized protein YndB with AHSA1/START domain
VDGQLPEAGLKMGQPEVLSPAYSVTVVRTVGASADELYAAWTEPDLMRRWMGTKVEADVRIGGQYRIENSGGSGEVYVHKGEYLVLEPGRRIVQTFLAGRTEPGPSQPVPYTNEFVEVKLRPLGSSATELTLVNGWDGEDLDEAGREAVKEAWSSWIDLLEAVCKNKEATS